MRRASSKASLRIGVGMLLLGAAAPPALADVEFDGHFYRLTSTAMNWSCAEAQAASLGGHLVTINDALEQAFLEETFLPAEQTAARPLWIGLTDEAAEGAFVWISGETPAYANWHSGEPNDFPSEGGEDYGAMNWHFAEGDSTTRGTWNDTPLGGTAGFSDRSDGPYEGLVELISASDVVFKDGFEC